MAVSFTPGTAAEAVGLATALIAKGHDLDLSIGQVNTRNLRWTGPTIETAFDACRNIAAGAKVLLSKYQGNPPDAGKAFYAASVLAAIPSVSPADDPPGPAPSPLPDPPLRDALHGDSGGLADLLAHPPKIPPKIGTPTHDATHHWLWAMSGSWLADRTCCDVEVVSAARETNETAGVLND